MDMDMARLAGLNAWRLTLVVLALATAGGFAVWGLVWVMWTIRPLLAVAASLGAAGWVLYAVRRHRLDVDWRDNEWLGS